MTDAGSVLTGQSVEHVFTIQNPFNEPITVAKDEDVRKQCGCTALMLQKRELLPGDSTTVMLELRIPHAPGPFERHSTITWSKATGKPHQVTLCMRGEAIQALHATPGSIVLDSTASGKVAGQ